MKLFKSLLVAPATLGLLAPLSATATEELNIADVSSYSSSEEVQNISDFSPELAITNSRVDGLEARLNDYEAGGFAGTTTASFGSTFYVGSVEEGAEDGATTFTYDFGMGINTSFADGDSFDVAIIGGNAGTTAVDTVMGGDSTTNEALTLDGVSYTFPFAGFTVMLGDSVGVDDLNTGACAYSAFTDTISDCGTPSIGGAADSAVAVSYDFGSGFTLAAGIGGGGGTDGLLSDEDSSTFGLEGAFTTDMFGVSLTYTDDDDTAGDSTYYSFQASFTPDAPFLISAGYEVDEDDLDSYFVGLNLEAGPGTVSLGAASQGLADDHDDAMQYELAYAYSVNDGMTITPGVFIVEAADDDEVGVVVTTSFSF